MSEAIKRLPDFIIIGAAKSGTTSLVQHMLQHPRIYISDPKEPCFFDENENWKMGIDWYSSLYINAKEDQICGEASTNYTRWPQVMNVPAKIKSIIPNVKLIYLLADPSKRAYSHFVHRWTKETHSGEPFKIGFFDYVKNDPMCLDSSYYLMQLERYLEYFPKEQILPVIFEQLIHQPEETMEKILNFLGLTMEQNMDKALPHANENKEFRYHMARKKLVNSLNQNKTIFFLKRFSPKPLRKYIYNRFFASLKIVKQQEEAMTPPALTKQEQIELIGMFKGPNKHLAREWNLDIDCWS